MNYIWMYSSLILLKHIMGDENVVFNKIYYKSYFWCKNLLLYVYLSYFEIFSKGALYIKYTVYCINKYSYLPPPESRMRSGPASTRIAPGSFLCSPGTDITPVNNFDHIILPSKNFIFLFIKNKWSHKNESGKCDTKTLCVFHAWTTLITYPFFIPPPYPGSVDRLITSFKLSMNFWNFLPWSKIQMDSVKL